MGVPYDSSASTSAFPGSPLTDAASPKRLPGFKLAGRPSGPRETEGSPVRGTMINLDDAVPHRCLERFESRAHAIEILGSDGLASPIGIVFDVATNCLLERPDVCLLRDHTDRSFQSRIGADSAPGQTNPGTIRKRYRACHGARMRLA